MVLEAFDSIHLSDQARKYADRPTLYFSVWKYGTYFVCIQNTETAQNTAHCIFYNVVASSETWWNKLECSLWFFVLLTHIIRSCWSRHWLCSFGLMFLPCMSTIDVSPWFAMYVICGVYDVWILQRPEIWARLGSRLQSLAVQCVLAQSKLELIQLAPLCQPRSFIWCNLCDACTQHTAQRRGALWFSTHNTMQPTQISTQQHRITATFIQMNHGLFIRVLMDADTLC